MQVKQPLVEALLAYKKEQVYPLHTPGHKGGRGMLSPLKELLGPDALAMDVSLMAELDDLHEPTGCLKQAQDLAARLYGSDACFFAVNGTTEAIQAMLLTALNPGDKVLIPRNAHRSVWSGLILAGAEPVYVAPAFVPEFAVDGQVSTLQIERAFEAEPELKAVLLTSPNYYGLAADVQAIAQVVHSRGAVLLVDEAHGPHLGFSDQLPPSALASGADMCSQSTHKLVGALTQCSMLQVRAGRVDLQRAADVMSLLTTTSPNYLLLASLDAARAQLEERGGQMALEALGAAHSLRQLLQEFPGLKVLDEQVVGRAGIAGVDLTKVLLNVAGWGLTGIAVGEFLRRQGLAVELVDAENVLFLLSYADATPEWPQVLVKLRRALRLLAEQVQATGSTGAGKGQAAKGQTAEGQTAEGPTAEGQATKKQATWDASLFKLPQTMQKCSLRQVFYGAKEKVTLAQAQGRICAESISFYPPGIPVVVQGEVLTPEILAYCQRLRDLGLPVHGVADSTLATLRVAKLEPDK